MTDKAHPSRRIIRDSSSVIGHCPSPLVLEDRTFEFGRRTYVVGIINMTSDSFSGDGLGGDADAARRSGEAMIEAGADLLDVGGVSTRPGAQPLPVAEEMARVIPAVAALADLGAPISVDTRTAQVARAAIEAGASMVNDISALTADPEMPPLVAETGVAVCLMHMQGTPETMQQNPTYGPDVVGEIAQYLRQRRDDAVRQGIAPDRIIVDPGIGFGKCLEHNLRLIDGLARLREETGCPVLVGPSRKSFIGQILGLPVEERLEGTAAAVAVAIVRGADFVRVHDVRAMARVARVADALTRPPTGRVEA